MDFVAHPSLRREETDFTQLSKLKPWKRDLMWQSEYIQVLIFVYKQVEVVTVIYALDLAQANCNQQESRRN